jgi:predicted amidohydrolase
MKLSVVAAQTRVSWDIQRNLAAIAAALAGTRRDELIVFPEAAVSGYDDVLSGLDRLDPASVEAAIDRVAEEACERGVHVFAGSLLHERGAWHNAALYFGPDGTRQVYRKINLATHERGRLTPGSALPVFWLQLAAGPVGVGIQLGREILFPEQWQYLAGSGAQLLLYLTNAANPSVPDGVWRSHLVSHAACNQRFVVAANITESRQHCPSAIASPRGEVLGELPSPQSALLRASIDTDECAGWYLSQRREDVLSLRYRDEIAGQDQPLPPVPAVAAQWRGAGADLGGDAGADIRPAGPADRP